MKSAICCHVLLFAVRNELLHAASGMYEEEFIRCMASSIVESQIKLSEAGKDSQLWTKKIIETTVL